jgi:Tfp pilus assembly protein PilV
MRGSTGMRGTGFRESESGFALIEVMVSAVLVVVLALATLKIIDSSQQASSTQRSRSIASNLAHADLDRMRQLTIDDADGLYQTATQKVSGLDFTVKSEAVWASDTGGVVTCSSGSTNAEYLRISSTVTWPNMGSAKPIVAESIISARASENDVTLGALTVLVQDTAANPVAGATVTAAGKTEVTDGTGCAIFARIPAGPTDVTFSKGGMVDKNNQSLGVDKNVSIVAGQTSLVMESYDYPTAVPAQFIDESNGSALSWSAVSLKGGNSVAVLNNVGGSTTSKSTSNLFPWTTGWSAYAGNCTGNDPDTYVTDFQAKYPAASVASVVNGTANVAKAYLRPVKLSVPIGGTNGLTANGRGRIFIKPDTSATQMSASCTGSGYVLTANIGSGSTWTPTVPMPYGVWKVCVDNGSSTTGPGTVTRSSMGATYRYTNYPTTSAALVVGAPAASASPLPVNAPSLSTPCA